MYGVLDNFTDFRGKQKDVVLLGVWLFLPRRRTCKEVYKPASISPTDFDGRFMHLPSNQQSTRDRILSSFEGQWINLLVTAFLSGVG